MVDQTPKFESLVQHLPSFDGKKETDIKFYIKQFDELADTTKLTDPMKVIVLKAKFSGQARETLINTPEINEETDYENLKKQLIVEFQSKITLEEAQDEFSNIKQQPTQSIDDFVKNFNIKALKYFQKSGHSAKQGAMEFFETVKLSKFLEAIRADISLEVRKRGPTKFEDAVKIAKQIESAFKTVHKEELNTLQTQGCNNVNETLLNLTTSQMTEIQKLRNDLEELKLKQNYQQDEKSIFCDICKISTHKTDNCFYNAKNKNKSQTMDYKNSQDRGKYTFRGRNMPHYPMYPPNPFTYTYMQPNYNAGGPGQFYPNFTQHTQNSHYMQRDNTFDREHFRGNQNNRNNRGSQNYKYDRNGKYDNYGYSKSKTSGN